MLLYANYPKIQHILLKHSHQRDSFESNFLSKEDKKRTLTYRSEIKRNQQMTKFRNQNKYLESLKMILIFDFIDDTNIDQSTFQ